MPTRFDKIAEGFSEIANDTKMYVRTPMLLNGIGEIRGKSVADFGCGSGYFTRIISGLWPQKVAGLDISSKLIELAGHVDNNLINYYCVDIRNLDLSERFDLITAVYLFDHAENAEDLRLMIESVSRHLKPHGQLFAIVPHPSSKPTTDYKYGRRIIYDGDRLHDGDKLICRVNETGKSTIDFDFYYYGRETYEKLLSDAGFIDIKWQDPIIADEGLKKYGVEYWQDYLSNPSAIGINCIRK